MIAINDRCSVRRTQKTRVECVAGIPMGGSWRGDEKGCRPFRKALSRDRRREIIAAYFRVLDQMKTSIGVESDLPYRKEIIRLAILEELAENSASDSKGLEIGYVQLEAFISPAEHRILDEFKNASRIAQDLVENADPATIMLSAGIMKNVEGDKAVRIQEKISERMRRRMTQILELTAG